MIFSYTIYCCFQILRIKHNSFCGAKRIRMGFHCHYLDGFFIIYVINRVLKYIQNYIIIYEYIRMYRIKYYVDLSYILLFRFSQYFIIPRNL